MTKRNKRSGVSGVVSQATPETPAHTAYVIAFTDYRNLTEDEQIAHFLSLCTSEEVDAWCADLARSYAANPKVSTSPTSRQSA